ncbi:MAG: shikimate kinase [Coprobacillus cateniformis]|uniref:shikimate kinase n=1 Tax=Longibaculum muris TaxID=1796628 RepID=UPI003AB7750C|nr:shikimate kinase [Coprobacillus cateniformis]
MKNIVLIGIMGCGKTTVSLLLAEKLTRPVIDIDEYLEKKYQMSIPEMFAISEAYFRERETICCQEVSKLDGYIISTGGGVIKNPENMKALKENGIVIYIDRPISMILEDVETSSRPLLKDGAEKLFDLYKERHQLYLDSCDYHIMNDVTIDELINNILNCIKENK